MMRLQILPAVLLVQMISLAAQAGPGFMQGFDGTCLTPATPQFTTSCLPEFSSDTTMEVSSSKNNREIILDHASQGALRLRNANSALEMNQIVELDSNLRMGLALLQAEGFQGSLLDAANKIIDLNLESK